MILSVVIPVYKIPEFLLKRCVESVLAQELYSRNSIEIILVDDGSPDDCGRWCDKYAASHEYVTAVHKENGGLSSARNYGKKYAKGEYITFLDADDWVDADYYLPIIEYMKKNKAEIGIGGMRIDTRDSSEIMGGVTPRRIMTAKEALLDMYTSNGFIWSVCDKIYKKKILDELVFDEKVLYGEDSLFSYQSFVKADVIAYVPLHGYHYCMRDDSMIHSFSENRFWLIKIYQYIYDEVKKQDKQLGDVVLDFYLTVLLDLMHSIRLDKKCYDKWEDLIRVELRKYYYRSCLSSRILSVKDRIKIILLGIMPPAINQSAWKLMKYIRMIKLGK